MTTRQGPPPLPDRARVGILRRRVVRFTRRDAGDPPANETKEKSQPAKVIYVEDPR